MLESQAMLSQEEELRIRETVRRSLDNILGAGPNSTVVEPPTSPAELQRISDAEQVIADETERYYQRLGRVKHIAQSGQAFWVTPGEKRRIAQRGNRHRREGLLASLTSRVALVWMVTFLLSALLVIYLVRTVSVAGLIE